MKSNKIFFTLICLTFISLLLLVACDSASNNNKEVITLHGAYDFKVEGLDLKTDDKLCVSLIDSDLVQDLISLLPSNDVDTTKDVYVFNIEVKRSDEVITINNSLTLSLSNKYANTNSKVYYISNNEAILLESFDINKLTLNMNSFGYYCICESLSSNPNTGEWIPIN